ncbi:hypothetical protein [Pseudohalocynthiibacter sp. F2068]|nr:hypothetical protein [Pseudohalocynthiibacter sp. F2068]
MYDSSGNRVLGLGEGATAGEIRSVRYLLVPDVDGALQIREQSP